MPKRARSLVLFVLLSFAAVDALAQSHTALLRQRGEAFAAALQAASDSAFVAFAREHLATALATGDRSRQFVARMHETLAELGPVDRSSVQVLGDERALFVYTRSASTGAWQNFQFRVLPDDEYRLQLVFRALASEPLARPATRLGEPETDAWLTRFAAALEAQHPFAGVALVRRGEQTLFSRVQGLADVESGRPIDLETRFGMASGSKLFTAVAVLQLLQAGRLGLDDPLALHLPDFPDRDFAARATIRQLLTHTAGAGNYWDGAYEAAAAGIRRNRDLLPFVLPHLGETPAGEFSYSNSGYLLLGLVVEAVSGMDYHPYLEQAVFAPAGMTQTGYPLPLSSTATASEAACGYDPIIEAGAVKLGSYQTVGRPGHGTAAGGAVSCAGDLLRFASALDEGRLLDAERLALLSELQVTSGAGDDSGWSCGAEISDAGGVHCYGHGGTAPGCQFELRIYPELDAVLLVMSNYNTIAAHEWAATLDALLRNPAP